MLPGADFDYNTEAGARYDNGVVASLINFMQKVWVESHLRVGTHTYDPDLNRSVYTPNFNHPFMQVYNRPNPWYDHNALWAASILSLVVDGNSYWKKLRARSGELVGLQYLPHFYVTPQNDNDQKQVKTYYRYSPPNAAPVKLDLSEVVHLTWGFDPVTFGRRGLSPVRAVLREIVTDNECTTYSAALLRNMGIPAVLISPRDVMADEMGTEKRERFKQMFKKLFTREGRGDPMVPSFPIDVKELGMSPEKMALDKIAQAPVHRICSNVGIDPMVLGFPSPTKTYDNYTGALEAAYRVTIKPLKMIWAHQLDAQLLDEDYGRGATECFFWDYSDVWVLQEDKNKQYERLSRGYDSGWLKRRDCRAEAGLPYTDEDNVYKETPGESRGPALASPNL